MYELLRLLTLWLGLWLRLLNLWLILGLRLDRSCPAPLSIGVSRLPLEAGLGACCHILSPDSVQRMLRIEHRDREFLLPPARTLGPHLYALGLRSLS